MAASEAGSQQPPPRPRAPPPAALSRREKAIAIIAGGIAAYSMRSAAGSLPPGTSLVDFVARAIPDELRGEVTAGLVDEVFAVHIQVSSALRA